MKKRLISIILCALMLSLLCVPALAEGETTGWYKAADGKWRYIGDDGAPLTGWQDQIPGWEGKWFYFDPDGKMKTGWAYGIPGWNGWFFFDENGVMKTGWVKDGEKWYFMDRIGLMVTGWLNEDGVCYYLNQDGVMLTGWANIDGCRYYFNESGIMQTNTVVDGIILGADGVAIGNATPTGSTISDGSLSVIVGVAAAAVFGLGGFFIGKTIGKKKKPVPADGVMADEEE